VLAIVDKFASNPTSIVDPTIKSTIAINESKEIIKCARDNSPRSSVVFCFAFFFENFIDVISRKSM